MGFTGDEGLCTAGKGLVHSHRDMEFLPYEGAPEHKDSLLGR